jgi:integrase
LLSACFGVLPEGMTTPAATKKAPRKPALKYPTWEHPKGSGIKIAEMPNKTGGQSYGVSYQIRIPSELLGVVGKRELLQRKTKTEAERLAEDRFLALKKHGTEFSKIPADAQKQAAIAWGILAEHNGKAGTSLNLIDAVKAGIRTLCPAGGRKTVSEVIAELIASKEERLASRGIDQSTVHDFKVRGGRIDAAFGSRFVGEVLHTEIADWLRKMRKDGGQFGRSLSARSIRNYRNTLAEVFRFATARQYAPENPFDRFTREDLKSLGGENADRELDRVNILTVEEARRLLEAAKDSDEAGMLASTVLRLFCGIRTAEVCRLDWSEVHWLDEKPYVHIPAGKAKKRRIRLVDIPENALAWLKLCNPPASGPIVPGTGDHRKDAKAYCFRFRTITKAAGIGKETAEGDWKSEWENNDTRHSFGSYHYALHGDALRTAAQMGHKQNDNVLFDHYRSLVRKDTAQQFFALYPPAKASKVERFPAMAG